MKLFRRILAAVLIAMLCLPVLTVGALAESKVKATGDVYLRASANKESAIKGVLPKGKSAAYLGKSSKDSRGVTWYKVKYNSKTGWVSSKYSTLKKSGSSGGSGKYKTTGNVNLRSAPGVSYKILKVVPKGKKVTYLKDKKKVGSTTWYYVQYSSYKGWVCGKYLSK